MHIAALRAVSNLAECAGKSSQRERRKIRPTTQAGEILNPSLAVR